MWPRALDSLAEAYAAQGRPGRRDGSEPAHPAGSKYHRCAKSRSTTAWVAGDPVLPRCIEIGFQLAEREPGQRAGLVDARFATGDDGLD